MDLSSLQENVYTTLNKQLFFLTFFIYIMDNVIKKIICCVSSLEPRHFLYTGRNCTLKLAINGSCWVLLFLSHLILSNMRFFSPLQCLNYKGLISACKFNFILYYWSKRFPSIDPVSTFMEGSVYLPRTYRCQPGSMSLQPGKLMSLCIWIYEW